MKICKKCNARNSDEAMRCSQCSAKLPKEIYNDNLVADTIPTKITKNHSCLFVAVRNLIIVIIVVGIFMALIGVIISCNADKILTEDKVPVVFDASVYDKVSKTELENTLGSPSRSENWTNDYGYDMLIYDYTQDGLYLSFFIHDDIVVKMYYMPDISCTYTGDIEKNAPELLGLGGDAEMYVDTNTTKKFLLDSDGETKELEFYDIDEENSQFGYVYIEFDHQYFT